MKAILREKLLSNALKLSEVSAIYLSQSHLFVSAYVTWLDNTECDLRTLRSPISIILQAEKSLLGSVLDGYLPDNVQGSRSIKKSQKAVAAQSLEKISREIYACIEVIDQHLDSNKEQLCQAVSVVLTKEVGLSKSIKANEAGADILWKKLESTPETAQIFHYLSTKLTTLDRRYLIMDILEKIQSNSLQCDSK